MKFQQNPMASPENMKFHARYTKFEINHQLAIKIIVTNFDGGTDKLISINHSFTEWTDPETVLNSGIVIVHDIPDWSR